jgi:gluconate 2-dehydrogenase gamma chain
MQGPFVENAAPEFGYQGKATPAETYREGLKGLKGFDRLSPEEQDTKLRQIESSHFFSVLRQNTIEGMFCDPIHGGNVDMVGWQLVGFPGPRMSNANDMDAHYGEAFRPKPMSLEQVTGRKVRPSEDEDLKS